MICQNCKSNILIEKGDYSLISEEKNDESFISKGKRKEKIEEPRKTLSQK